VRSEQDPITVAVGCLGCVIGAGLLRILGNEDGLRVVGSDLDHAELELAVTRHGARVVILDEDSVAGPSVPRRLRDVCPAVGLVVLAHRPTRAYAKRMVALGVTVCLSTDASAPEIAQGVRLAADGTHVFVSMSSRSTHMGRSAGLYALTRREREVLELLSRGQKNAEVARELHVSTETARTHAKHIYNKLGVSSRDELLGIEQ
jgi:DNA-binding NarL/FixJ family response regulator